MICSALKSWRYARFRIHGRRTPSPPARFPGQLHAVENAAVSYPDELTPAPLGHRVLVPFLVVNCGRPIGPPHSGPRIWESKGLVSDVDLAAGSTGELPQKGPSHGSTSRGENTLLYVLRGRRERRRWATSSGTRDASARLTRGLEAPR